MFASTAAVCQVVTFMIGVSKVCFLGAPIGRCQTCCSHNDTMDIQFLLFTRTNPNNPRPIQVGNPQSLASSGFDPLYPTVIYLMGFSEDVSGISTTTMKNAFMTSGNYNFIAVDWSRLIAFPWYVSAVRNTRYMGRRLANFVQFLESAGVPASSLHVVGFSLGAEAAGFGGKELRRRGLLLGRITGLDPAYPGYGLNNNDGHLARGDAAFVDVLHTNPGLFGFPQPIGDVDFYPNHGQWVQPGCWVDQLARHRQLGYLYGCSHNRAWRLFAESVRSPTAFPATLCRDWRSATRRCDFQADGMMGMGASPSMRGKMYLETNESPPFAKRSF